MKKRSHCGHLLKSTHSLFCLDAKEFVSSAPRAIDVAKCSCICRVSGNEGYFVYSMLMVLILKYA